jgi:hypothetical protein
MRIICPIKQVQELIECSIKWIAPKIAVRDTNCINIKVMLFTKGNRYFIHLINYASWTK